MTDDTGTTSLAATIAGALVVLAVLGAVTVLTWHGSITGEAAVAVFSAVLGGGIVGGAVHVGNSNGAKAATRGMIAGDTSRTRR